MLVVMATSCDVRGQHIRRLLTDGAAVLGSGISL